MVRIGKETLEMHMDMLLTVIVPIFVGEEDDIIERLGLPLMDQPDGVEFVFVCATDNSDTRQRVESRLGGMAERVRIEYISPNKGLFSLAEARNTGARRARGRLLLFWDVDLFAHGRFYENIFRFIESRKMLERENIFYPIPAVYLRPLSITQATSEYRDISWHDDLLFSDASRGIEDIHRISSSVLVGRDFYLTVGGQYEGFEGWGYEDWHFLWKLLLFPQPVPEPSDKEKPSFGVDDYFASYHSWRAAAEMLGEEALRANLFCYHVHHAPRNEGWKTRKSDNRILFDKLTGARRTAINFERRAADSTSEKVIEIFSDCPSVANRLYYSPTAAPRVFRLEELKKRVRSGQSDERGIDLILGGIRQSSEAVESATWLKKRGIPFHFVAPTGLSSRNMMIDFDGSSFRVHAGEANGVGIMRRLHMEAGGLEYAAAADAYRAEIGAKGGKVVLLRMSDVRIGKDTDAAFGVEDEEMRSLAYGLAPLFGSDVIFVVYDPRNESRDPSPFSNLFFAGGRDIEMLYEAADLVITQSPFDIWQGLIRGRQVATTGHLAEVMVKGVPTLSGVEEVYRWVHEVDGRISVKVQEGYLQRLEKITSAFVLAAAGEVEPEKLDGHSGSFRVLYEKVNHSLHSAAYKFTWDSWERRVFHMVSPQITKDMQMKFHREVDHDFALFRRLSRNRPVSVVRAPIKGNGVNSKKVAAAKEEQRSSFSPSGDFVATPDTRMGLVKNGPGTLGRKLKKFRRDPYRYFADAKSPVVRPLKNLFAG